MKNCDASDDVSSWQRPEEGYTRITRNAAIAPRNAAGKERSDIGTSSARQSDPVTRRRNFPGWYGDRSPDNPREVGLVQAVAEQWSCAEPARRSWLLSAAEHGASQGCAVTFTRATRVIYAEQ